MEFILPSENLKDFAKVERKPGSAADLRKLWILQFSGKYNIFRANIEKILQILREISVS